MFSLAPPGFARESGFWQAMFCSGIFGVVLGLVGLVFLNFADHIPTIWVDNGEFDEPEDAEFYAGILICIVMASMNNFIVRRKTTLVFNNWRCWFSCWSTKVCIIN